MVDRPSIEDMSREVVSAASIADDLRAGIAAGTYRPGDRLPGENSLMQSYDVARMTARHALAMLRDEGLTVTRKGVGVFVREFQPLVRNSIARVSSRQWGAGRAVWEADNESRALVVDSVEVDNDADAPATVRQLLAVGEADRIVSRSRRFVLDGKPVQLATSYLPAAIVAGSAITEQDTGPGGTYARLKELGHAPAHFREDVIARMPSTAEREALQIAPGTPVLDITRTAVTSDGTPVEVNHMTLDAAAFVTRYDFEA